jgi:hypothetical protein
MITKIVMTRTTNCKRFQCLLNPAWDDPIFIGISRLAAKGVNKDEQVLIQYPCQVVNRFRCPYDKTNSKGNSIIGITNTYFDVNDLFRLQKMAFAIEISLAKTRKEDSRIKVLNKEELLHALTDKEVFAKIIEQATEADEVDEYLRTYLAEKQDDILNYFMKIRNKANLEGLRFY